MFPGRLPDGRSLGFPSNSPSPAVTLANQGIKQMAFLNGATNGFTNGDASHKSKPRSIDDNVLKSASLEALQGTEQRKIMDIVDRLRRTGLSSVLQLPQLVVCGDQSSGKSSVLEAITEIPFPRKENLCTRFATEIVLRRDNTSSISTKITPDKARPPSEQSALRAFSKSINDFSELPRLIEEATELMGLNATDTGSARAFSKDVLSIEITGPGRPQLTLVDLPGLIHSENKSQSALDVKLIHNLVEEYISNERTIILAVVSAKNDYANQIILKKAQEVDKEGNRTLGIITKPDFLRTNTENERSWLDLAQNKDVFFKLGWHMLKNRADGELGTSVKERNEAEAAFFSKGSYAELDRSVVGIETLRDRLSHTLNEHLKKELPGLKRELDKKLEDTSHQLALLGSSRATIAEQKQYLTEIGMRAHDIFKSAVHGHYEQSFFHGMDTDERIDAGQNIRRLRSVIQYLNLEFAKRMRLSSRKYIITDDKGKEIEEDENEGSFPMEVDKSDLESAIDVKLQAPVHVPKKLTRKEAVVWVMRVLRRSRGRELPGNFNPMLISQLFWEQSTPWEAVSVQHIETVADICRQFVGDVIKSIASKDIEVRLQSARVESALDEALKSAKVELKKIIDDKQRHPITYNHYYTMTIQKMRRKKHNKVVKKMADDSKRQVSDQHRNVMTMIDPATLENLIDNHVELDMDKFSAEEALDSVSAYYKNKLKYFIDVVTEQVIERHLIDPLANTILSPIVIAGLTDEEVSYIAAEPSDVTQKRNFLEVRKKMLEDGQDTFRRAMGGLR